jgi:hypothetical protein
VFEARVAQFYRAKGYEVHENPKVRGSSENVYAVAMVADGPLGALLISFGDAGGIDAAELGRVRTMARDIGATPVIATPTMTPDLRRLAAQMAVVVVDESMVTDTGPLPKELPNLEARPDLLRRDMDAHPWPASGRAFSLAAAQAAPAGARDVDELIAALHQPAVTAKPTPAPSLVAPQVVAPTPAPAPGPSHVTAQATAPGTKFSWLNGGQTLMQSETKPATEFTLSDVFSARPGSTPARPAAEHEELLVAKPPVLQRAQVAAWTSYDTVRDWPWKTIILAVCGGGLLVLFIRWFA